MMGFYKLFTALFVYSTLRCLNNTTKKEEGALSAPSSFFVLVTYYCQM